MQVTVTDQQQRVLIPPAAARKLEAAVAAALTVAAAPSGAAVDVTFVDDAAIQALNRDWRGIDEPTDVLSFALNEADDAELEPDGALLLGDVIISAERAAAQAVAYGHSLERELAYLAVHGTLHLLGYDHDDPHGQQQMREKEEEALRQLGLTREASDGGPATGGILL